jgi:S-adenosyl methyltransferase
MAPHSDHERYGPRTSDPHHPNAARIYEYVRGGAYHFEVDRVAAEKILQITPQAREMALYNRAWLHRVVRHLVTAGVRQFLDIGSGIPAEDNLHRVAQQIAPDTRVVYVDYDSVPVDRGCDTLADNKYATYVHADLRLPDTVLNHPDTVATLDFTQPIAMMWAAVLHFVEDQDDPFTIFAHYRNALKSGDFIALSHATHDLVFDEYKPRARDGVVFYNDNVAEHFTPRSVNTISKFFAGTEILDPGVVPLPDWRPEDPAYTPDETDLARGWLVGGVGRLP